jgi:transcriptional regulator with XRE-family HTH domain
MEQIFAVLGANVRKRRQALSMTQEQLANKMGKDPREIRAIEAGRRNVTIKTLYKLCQALETTADELLSF